MSRRTALNIALAVAGVALLAWQIENAGGLDSVTTGLLRVGAGFIPILALAVTRFVLRSYAWITLLGEPAPLSAAVAATISGDALGNLTPLGLAASEPAKAVYLGRHVDSAKAFAALTAENFFYSVSVAVYVIVGALAMLATYPHLPDPVRLAGIASLGLMATLLVGAGWIAWQQPAAASAILSRIPSARIQAVVARVRDFETRTYGSAGHEGARLGVVAATECAFHVVSYAESWLTLYLLTGASRPIEALILDSVNRVINVVFKLVPLRMGVDEVSAEAVGRAMGLALGVGLTAGLVRKVRMLALAIVGLALWAARR